MGSVFEGLERRLAAGAATVAPGALLEWELSHPDPAAAMRIAFRSVDGVRIRYAMSGGPAERTVLLTSPWPEGIYAFAPIWPALADRVRLVAVDLPGFGASEGRAELRSPQAMGAFLVRLIDSWGLGRPHLVAPDVGTLAALFAALRSPESMSSLVVGSGGSAVPIESFGTLDPRAVVDGAISTIAGHKLPQAVREDYYASYTADRLVEAMAYFRRYPDDLPVLAERLGEMQTPVMVFAGLRDRVVPLTDAGFLSARLPNCRLATLGAGHFVWEEAPDAFRQLLDGWIDEHTPNPGGFR